MARTSPNVVGPIRQEDWLSMIELRGIIKYFEGNKDNPEGLAKDIECYNYFIREYIEGRR